MTKTRLTGNKVKNKVAKLTKVTKLSEALPADVSSETLAFASLLENWYPSVARVLPWRETSNAYHLWLSEVMLQQTQVVTVIPYYHRFLKAFPTIEALAQADESSVLKLWEGLGYYSRCRNLHKAAKQIVFQHQGRFPDKLEEVLALPGIGKSTAGAILTFAYAQKHPLLDGNVKRVLCRLLDIAENPEQSGVQKQLWQASTALLKPATQPYIYNQAIMELGATICTPTQPKCLLCPVKTICKALKQGTVSQRPLKTAKKPVPHYTVVIGVIKTRDNQVFIQKRPDKGLLGGLWEFPGGKAETDEALEDALKREFLEELSYKVTQKNKLTKLAIVKHAYTHFKITMHAYLCEVDKPPTLEPKAAQAWQWVNMLQLKDFAFPKANKVVVERLLERAD